VVGLWRVEQWIRLLDRESGDLECGRVGAKLLVGSKRYDNGSWTNAGAAFVFSGVPGGFASHSVDQAVGRPIEPASSALPWPA